MISLVGHEFFSVKLSSGISGTNKMFQVLLNLTGIKAKGSTEVEYWYRMLEVKTAQPIYYGSLFLVTFFFFGFGNVVVLDEPTI